MDKHTPEITRLIHDNLWIVISFAFGRPTIARILNANFVGEWKYLNKTIYERAEIRADRALLERRHSYVFSMTRKSLVRISRRQNIPRWDGSFRETIARHTSTSET
jgi:hypothetical protein